MSKKNILFLLDNPYSNDRRVMREAEALNQSVDFTVQVIATFESNFAKQETRDLTTTFNDDMAHDKFKNIGIKLH